eukprot:gene6152-7662_t
MGVFKDRKEDRAYMYEILKFSREFWGFAKEGEIEFVGEYCLWVFKIDDILEEPPFSINLFENQTQIWTYGKLPENPLPAEVFTLDIRNQLEEFCGPNRKDAFYRYINAILSCLDFTVPLYESRTLKYSSYLKLRWVTCGENLFNAIMEILYCKELDTRIFYDPIYRKMEYDQGLVVGIVNDMFSYEKELQSAQPQANAMFILQNNHGENPKPTMEESFKTAIDTTNDCIRDYIKNETLFLEKYLPLMKTEQERQDLVLYVKYFACFMAGNLQYSLTSVRYSCSTTLRKVMATFSSTKTSQSKKIRKIMDKKCLNQLKIPKGLVQESVRDLTILLLLNEPSDLGNIQDVLEIGSIPNSVKTLSIDHQLVEHNISQLIPESVTDLEFQNWRSTEGVIGFFDSIRNFKISYFLSKAYQPQHLIYKGNIPESAEKVVLPMGLNQDITNGLIPNSVKSLEMVYYHYSFSIHSGALPNSIRKLVVDAKIPQSILQGNEILPLGLEYLKTRDSWTPQTKLPPTLTELHCEFERIPIGFLPPTLQSLHLRGKVNQIDLGAIPESVKSITFLDTVLLPIIKGTLPSLLVEVKFMRGISSAVQFPHIPNGVKYLEISTLHPEDNTPEIPVGSLPESIMSIKLSGTIRKQYLLKGVLPSRLKALDFTQATSEIPYDGYSSILDHSSFILHQHSDKNSCSEISANVESISMQISENNQYQYITNLIPTTTKKLILYFDNIDELSPIPMGSIPLSVRKLRAPYSVLCQGKDTESLIPDSVTNLIVMNCEFKDNGNEMKIPHNVVKLKLHISSNYNGPIEQKSIPPNIKELFITSSYRPPNDHNIFIKDGAIPKSISRLKFGKYIFQPIQSKDSLVSYNELKSLKIRPGPLFSIPPSVTHLEMKQYYRLPDEFIFPSMLTVFECDFEEILRGMIPPNINVLIFHSQIKLLQSGSIPSTVTRLEFKNEANTIGEINPHLKTLPQLTYLDLSYKYSAYDLPDSVKHLRLENPFQIFLRKKNLPTQLQSLEICSSFSKPSDYYLTFPHSLVYLKFSTKWVTTNFG